MAGPVRRIGQKVHDFFGQPIWNAKPIRKPPRVEPIEEVHKKQPIPDSEHQQHQPPSQQELQKRNKSTVRQKGPLKKGEGNHFDQDA